MRTGSRTESRPGTRCSHDAEIMMLPHGRVSAGDGYWRKSNGLWPHASAFAQVTGSGLRHVKIVRVFKLVLLNSAPSSAPSRIRTYAHGSGGRLWPCAKSRCELVICLSGEHRSPRSFRAYSGSWFVGVTRTADGSLEGTDTSGREVTVTAHGAERAEQPSRDEPVSVEELARRKGVRAVESVDDIARPDLFESDGEWQEFLADLYASRRSGLPIRSGVA